MLRGANWSLLPSRNRTVAVLRPYTGSGL
ncbi:hypothetical protein PENSTE_c011G08535 [Penicillium steckii]|uniref:Uncharacterized protein n=1 Tax=Penicillium steckii TaxID=303698 RepID=A0A1V6T608_9EURO|nr:hypothetical protein PENSTE_c011G08535 [Penicillium steckii]